MIINRKIGNERSLGNGFDGLKRGEDLNRMNKGISKINLLNAAMVHLDKAAKNQPCPVCKKDIETLKGFLSAKVVSMERTKELDRKEIKKLDSIDFVNEMTGFGITVTKILGPFTKKVNAPKLYGEVLEQDMKPNRTVKEELILAREALAKLPNDGTSSRTLEIIDSFIKAVEFKLSIDPVLFYVFDRTLKLGYKTHTLGAVSRMILAFKKIGRFVEGEDN